MDRLLGSKSLPPGFRFHPTDEELCMYYLKRKVMGRSLGVPMMAEVDVYKFAPWDLPLKACVKTRDLIWYYFCPRGKKYGHSGRSNRATEFGYWKSTGTDRNVQYKERTVGKIKTLVFYRGKAPKGERTDWVMHEYRLEDQVLVDMGVPQDAFVVCKVYEKSGPGPRNGEHHGAHFVEEEWETDDDDNVEGDNGIIVHSVTTAARQDAHGPSAHTASENVSNVTMDTCNVTATASTAFTGFGGPINSKVTSFVDTSAGTSAVGAENVGAVASFIPQQQAPLANGPLIPDQFAGDEIDCLLSMFTEEELNVAQDILSSDIFDGLEDLPGDYLELDDLN